MSADVQEITANLLINLQHEIREPKFVEIEENCRLGLGKNLLRKIN